jgi:Txe/YoeB family toxin of toxin-antitoxin system
MSNKAEKDYENARNSGYAAKIAEILNIVANNPKERTRGHRLEKLKGYPEKTYSRRINDQHRFVYQILDNTQKLRDRNGKRYRGIVFILRMWKHYE